MITDDPRSEAAAPTEDHHGSKEQKTDSDSYTMVQFGGKTRRIPKVVAGVNTLVGVVPLASKDGRVQNVPPLPLELYHGKQTLVNQEEKRPSYFLRQNQIYTESHQF